MASYCPRFVICFLCVLIISVPAIGLCAQSNYLAINKITTKEITTNKTSSKSLMPSDSQNNNHTVQIVDIPSVSADNPQAAIKTINFNKSAKTIKCDIFIAGGGLGGLAAAIKIWQMNEKQKRRPLKVVISEETDWLGGQATVQGVSALDENYLVESTGCTDNYQQLRTAIRHNYKRKHALSSEAAKIEYFNPGNCWVSRLSFEPKVALEEIDKMLAAGLENSALRILYRHKPFFVQHRRRFSLFSNPQEPAIKSIYLTDLNNGEQINVRAKVFLDATECGDLLPLANTPYKTGDEAKADTSEPHAPDKAAPENVQDFTYPFALEWRPGENHTISKPALYDDLVAQGKFSFDQFKMFVSAYRDTPEGKQELLPFWTYRRLIDSANFTSTDRSNDYPHDIAMINWSGNDVRQKNIIDKSAQTQAEHLAFGKLVSLGFLYWLQTAAPRDEGGTGYPELLLRPEIMGTQDGLSKHPYIRESRRAVTKYTVIEQDIAKEFNKSSARAKEFSDSVGIGLYPIDIHGHEEIPGAGQLSNPFQIPLGSLIPQKYNRLLPACKNIGVTHITNGAYRLHPIEWAIGEAQGALSHYCLSRRVSPDEVLTHLPLLRDFQRQLIESGVPIYWFDDLAFDCPAFAGAQYLAVSDIMPGAAEHLHFSPDKPITREEVAYAVKKLSAIKPPNKNDLKILNADALTRGQFAICLYKIVQSKPYFGKI